MKDSKKTKAVVTEGESICKTPEERERLFRFIGILYEIDKREHITGFHNLKSKREGFISEAKRHQ